MAVLSQDFVASCPVEGGFRLRGESMTRIEVFVDAAFAFSLTMLVISIDEIPKDFQALIEVTKQVPAFVLSVAVMSFFWWTHAVWSKRFGLEDTRTVLLSVALLMVVFVYIYPLKTMLSGAVSFLSNQYFPSPFGLNSADELRGLFTFFGIGSILVCALVILLYRHAINQKEALLLSYEEVHHCNTLIYLWANAIATVVVAVALAHSVADKWVPWTGFVYSTFSLTMPTIGVLRQRHLVHSSAQG